LADSRTCGADNADQILAGYSRHRRGYRLGDDEDDALMGR
jgi:hypothetical protein